MAIDRDSLAAFPAQEFIQRHPRELGLDVPQRHVHARQGVVQHRPVAPVRVDPRRPPEVLDPLRLLAAQERPKEVLDGGLDRRVPLRERRAAETVKARLGGLDFDHDQSSGFRLSQNDADVADRDWGHRSPFPTAPDRPRRAEAASTTAQHSSQPGRVRRRESVGRRAQAQGGRVWLPENKLHKDWSLFHNRCRLLSDIRVRNRNPNRNRNRRLLLRPNEGRSGVRLRLRLRGCETRSGHSERSPSAVSSGPNGGNPAMRAGRGFPPSRE